MHHLLEQQITSLDAFYKGFTSSCIQVPATHITGKLSLSRALAPSQNKWECHLRQSSSSLAINPLTHPAFVHPLEILSYEKDRGRIDEICSWDHTHLACFVHNQFPWNRIQPAPDVRYHSKPAFSDEYRSKCEALLSSMRKRSETTRYTFIAFISAYKMQNCAGVT